MWRLPAFLLVHTPTYYNRPAHVFHQRGSNVLTHKKRGKKKRRHLSKQTQIYATATTVGKMAPSTDFIFSQSAVRFSLKEEEKGAGAISILYDTFPTPVVYCLNIQQDTHFVPTIITVMV